MDEDQIKILDGNQKKVLEIHKREKIVVSNNEEDMGSIEQKQSSTCIQKISTNVFVEDDLKDKVFQSSEVKVQKKSLLQMRESMWRPKTRDKNKLRLNMKRILNPKLKKENITLIEGSSTEEDMESEKGLIPQQVYIEEEH